MKICILHSLVKSTVDLQLKIVWNFDEGIRQILLKVEAFNYGCPYGWYGNMIGVGLKENNKKKLICLF